MKLKRLWQVLGLKRIDWEFLGLAFHNRQALTVILVGTLGMAITVLFLGLCVLAWWLPLPFVLIIGVGAALVFSPFILPLSQYPQFVRKLLVKIASGASLVLYWVERFLGEKGFYLFMWTVAFIMAKALFGFRSYGKENIPQHPRFIVISRHQDYLDIPFVGLALGARRVVKFIAWNDLETLRVMKFLEPYYLGINRVFGRKDWQALKNLAESQKPIVIYPEGSLDSDRLHLGAIKLAHYSDRFLLPLEIEAQGEYPPRSIWRLPRITVWIGKPFKVRELGQGLSDLPRKKRQAELVNRLAQRLKVKKFIDRRV